MVVAKDLAIHSDDALAHADLKGRREVPSIGNIHRYQKGERPTIVSPISYAGSKRAFVDILARFIPDGMLEYREPFFGAGNVYFNFAQQLRATGAEIWVNEYHRGLYCYWLYVRDDPDALWIGYRRKMHSLEGDEKAARQASCDLWDIMEQGSELEAAIALATANHLSYSGKMVRGSFSLVSFRNSNLIRRERVSACNKLLQGVRITNLDFHDVISPSGDGVFVVLDPPYDDTPKLYQEQMNYETFLVDLIETPHSWLVTHSDTWRNRNRILWTTLLRSDSVKTHFYEMSSGINVKQKDYSGKKTKADGSPVTASDLRLEVLLTNYDPKSDIWQFWKQQALAKSGPQKPIDWSEVYRQMAAGEGMEIGLEEQ